MAACPECHGDIPDEATRCRHCGARLRSARERNNVFWATVLIVGIGILVVAALFGRY